MKKIGSALAAILLIAIVITGCFGNVGPAESGSAPTQASTAPGTAASTQPTTAPQTEAPKEPTNLSFFSWLNSKSALAVTSYDDVRSMQMLEEVFNVDIEWLHPPIGQETEQFNLMVASQDLPDMIYWPWQNAYAGGPGKAVADGVIIQINEYIDKASALSAVFEKYPDAKKQSMTNEGILYMFPCLAEACLYPEYQKFTYYVGPTYRRDLADSLEIQQPVTMDDWYNMLTAFKGISDDFIPYTCTMSFGNDHSIYKLCAPFGVLAGFYLEDGGINYGLLSERFKSYVETMAKWYAEGLIDKDFLANDSNAFRAKITNGDVGAFIGSLNGNYTTFSKTMETTVPEAHLSPIPWPTGEAGSFTAQDDVNIIVSGGWGAAITPQSSNIELCVALLDYGYTDEGRDLLNLGVYGETYTRDSTGKIVWTEETAAEMNEKGNDFVLGREAFAYTSSWATLQSIEMTTAFPVYGEQLQARDNWGAASPALIVPPITPTVEEASALADIMNRVITYRDEMVGKMIMGQVPLSDYDTVVANLNEMGIQDALDIQNRALEAYNAR
ncbi:MAG: hypothetical protein ACOX8S_10100 [Christensenellales bacterium]